MVLQLDYHRMLDAPHTGLAITQHDLLRMAPSVEHCLRQLAEGSGDNKDGTVTMLGWQESPLLAEQELAAIRTAAERLRANCEVIFIVGIGGSYLGPKAMLELLGRQTVNPELHFLGYSTDPVAIRRTLAAAEGKRCGCVMISKSGSTIEPGVAFRLVRTLLNKATSRDSVVVITGPGNNNPLRVLAEQEGWLQLIIPPAVGGRFSLLSPVGLLPGALAGISPDELLQGAAAAKKCCDLPSLRENPAALYAALKQLAIDKGACVEYQVTNIQDFEAMLGWTIQLEAESEGHFGHGVHIIPALFPRDLHSIGQLIQQGPRNCYSVATTLPVPSLAIPTDKANSDGLSPLAERLADFSLLNTFALEGALNAHREGGVPSMTIALASRSAQCLGAYCYFLMKATAIQGYLLRHNPFIQPGVKQWKESLQDLAAGKDAGKATLQYLSQIP